jgi:type VI secretion system protein ImpM
MLTQPVLAPGFFGKVPARGDFVSRRLPAVFRAEWESWLAGLVVAARDALGESWPNDWLIAPLWHFVLGRGRLPPNGGAGVLVASADRVGRLYPFTIIGAASGPPHANSQALNGWARSAEALTLGALEDDFEPDALDAALVALGPPPALSGPDYPAGHWRLSFDGDWPSDLVDNGEDSAVRAPGPDQSVWFCRGSDRVPPVHLRCVTLPDHATAAAMITGDFNLPAG